MNNYYCPHEVPAWDVIDFVMGYYESDLSGSEAFYVGNVLKYLLRYKYKGNAKSDLNKSIDYLKKVIEIN